MKQIQHWKSLLSDDPFVTWHSFGLREKSCWRPDCVCPKFISIFASSVSFSLSPHSTPSSASGFSALLLPFPTSVFDLFSLIIDLKFFDLAQANLTPNYGFNHPINIQQNRLGVLFICYKFCLISIVQWHFINMKTNKLDTQNWANAMQIKLMVSGGLILWGS